MTVTINWESRVITVPKVDTTLIQSVPTEIREHDMNVFRLVLRDIEDSEEGIVYQNTHNHFAPIGVGGITLARVVELINNYTVTYEDGQYAINIIGGNSNIGDNVNVNQVSVRSFNSAGLVTSAGIEAMEYNNAVWVDVNSVAIGALYPVGTPRLPTNNIPDAILIAENRGFSRIHIIGNFTLDTGDDIAGYTVYGQDSTKTLLTVNTGAYTAGAIFENMTVTGVFDDAANFHLCSLIDIQFVQGYIYESVLNGTITLAGSGLTGIYNCWDGKSGDGSATFPVINFNGSGRSLIMRNYFGDLILTNKTGSEITEIDQSSGIIELASTITNGIIKIRGTVDVIDNSTGSAIVDISQVIDPSQIASYVWDEVLIGSEHNVTNSAGKRLRDLGSQVVHTDTAQGSAANGNQIQLALSAADYDGAYDPSRITIIDGTGAGQTRLIYEYEGSIRTATVDRDWKIPPDITSEYIVFADAGREHINEGLARGGTINTITLNALASDVDNVYEFQSVFIRSGKGQDQVGHVASYDGTTKIVTLHHPWLIIPDITSGYAILPTHENPIGTAQHVWNYDITSTVGTAMAGYILKLVKDYNINKMRWDEDNSRFVIYDDDNTTPLHYVNVTNKSDGSIVMDSEAVVNREGQENV